jgi:putative peptide zinc metalloprotease protein
MISPDAVLSDLGDGTDSIILGLAGKYYRLAGASRDIMLTLREDSESFREIESERLARYSVDEIQLVLLELERRGLVVAPDKSSNLNRLLSPLGQTKKKTSYMQLQVSIFPQSWVAAMAYPISLLMTTSSVLFGLPVFIALQLVFAIHYGTTMAGNLYKISPSSLVILVIANYGCLLLHELGHAAGSLRAGQPPGEIGIGLYLIYPVMYIDVSKSWLIPARTRLLIDAGGLYLTGLLAFVSGAIYTYGHHPVFGILTYLLVITTIANLNPFLRMDGYWIVSDLLGIHDLMGKTLAINQWLFGLILRKKYPMPSLGVTEGWKRWGYFLYFIFSTAFFIYMIITVLFSVIPSSMRATSLHAHAAILVFNGVQSVSIFWIDVLKTMLSSLPLILFALPIVLQLWKRVSSRPAQEVLP